MARALSLRRAIPEAAKPPLRSLAAALDPFPRALHRLRGGESVPPRQLRVSVGQPSLRAYLAEGRVVAAEVERLLAGHGRPLASFAAVCDLASGPGKVLRALPLGAGASVAALDVNAASIAWLRAHAAGVDARVVAPLPPSSFPDASFDLVLSISLFTHLPERAQDAWLAEVGRLLTDDGLALLTVHGETAYEGFRSGRRPGITAAQLRALRARGPLGDEGFAFEPEPDPEARSPGVAAEWGLAFHHPSYVRRRWSERLEIEAIVPAAVNFRQDAVLARRPQARR